MNVRVAPIEVPPTAMTIPAQALVLPVLLAISFSHMLNDLIQSLIPSIYPLLKANYGLSFAQIGRPYVDVPDHRVAVATGGGRIDRPSIDAVLAIDGDGVHAGRVADAVAGAQLSHAAGWPRPWSAIGSSVFHPESSRVARMASGGRHGLAQSVFQVGGNAGQAIGPVDGRLGGDAARARAASASGCHAGPRRGIGAIVLWRKSGSWYGAACRAPAGKRGQTHRGGDRSPVPGAG